MSYHRALGMPSLRTGAVIGMNHLDYVPDYSYVRCGGPHMYPQQSLGGLPPKLALAWARAQARRRHEQLGESGDGLGGILAVL